MSKQTSSLSKEYQVLLKLLRLAIGTEPMLYFGDPVEPFPNDIDWKEVIRLSYKQKVSALAVDGLNSIKYTVPDHQTQNLFDSWFKDVENIEKEYNYYLQVIQTICQLFASYGLRTIILKGIGLSQNYPHPSHRGAGDIDLFLIDENGKQAAEKGVQIVESVLGVKTDKTSHDYFFQFKGIIVELHYSCTNRYWDTDSEKYIVKYLDKSITHNIIPYYQIDSTYFPDGNFYALYLIRHMYGHFYTASINLRQLVDWVTFVRTNLQNVDWLAIEDELKSSGMYKFYLSINRLVEKWFLTGFQHSCGEDIEPIITQDWNCPINYNHHITMRMKYFFENRLKLKYLTGYSWLKLLLQSLFTSAKNKLYCKL